jgi:hypothetical protein
MALRMLCLVFCSLPFTLLSWWKIVALILLIFIEFRDKVIGSIVLRGL